MVEFLTTSGAIKQCSMMFYKFIVRICTQGETSRNGRRKVVELLKLLYQLLARPACQVTLCDFKLNWHFRDWPCSSS